MVPQVGDDVLVLVDPAINSGADVAPAKLTRVWDPVPHQGTWGEFYSVNAKVFLDASNDLWMTSIGLYADEASARGCREVNPTTQVAFPRSAVVR